MVDNEYHGQMSGAKAVRVVKKLRRVEQEAGQ
jgi:hypothetical protein